MVRLDRNGGLDWYDYGARMYDAALGRWHSIDPLSEELYNYNLYNYCINNPTNAVDPDGKKIIFVNGYLGFGSPQGGATYWGGNNGRFVNGAQSFFNDANTYFTNYDFNYWTSSTYLRTKTGYNYAKENYDELISGMDPQKDIFHVISHSMGGAFSQGMIQYLKEKGWVTDMAIYLNAWQPSELIGIEGTFAVDATITNDWVQGLSLPINGDRDIPSADYRIRKKSEKGWQYRHRDLIDSGELWNAENNLTWNDIAIIVQSWLQKKSNIKINNGQ